MKSPLYPSVALKGANIIERLLPDIQARKHFLDPSPNILVCGLPRSGKSSIIKVVFAGASPHETLSLSSNYSTQVLSVHHSPMINCTLIDLSGAGNAGLILPSVSMTESTVSSRHVLTPHISPQNGPIQNLSRNPSGANTISNSQLDPTAYSNVPQGNNYATPPSPNPHNYGNSRMNYGPNDGEIRGPAGGSGSTSYPQQPNNYNRSSRNESSGEHAKGSPRSYNQHQQYSGIMNNQYTDAQGVHDNEQVNTNRNANTTMNTPRTVESVASSRGIQNIITNPLLDPVYDEVVFPSISAVLFVIDAQNDPYSAEIANAKDIFKRAWKVNPRIKFEVFIHKVDGDFFALDEVRVECQREIHDKLMNYLHEEGISANVVFFSTSIYDHTVYEACSKMIQNLIPQITTCCELLDILTAKCKMEKAFLLDTRTKLCIATDTSAFDPSNYEVCSDLVELIFELITIYASEDEKVMFSDEPNFLGSPTHSSSSASVTGSFPEETIWTDYEMGYGEKDANTLPSPSVNLEEGNEFYESNASDKGSSIGSPVVSKRHNEKPARYHDPAAMCTVQLNTGHFIYIRQIDSKVVLACIIREENFDRQFLVDYNIKVFQNSALGLFGVRK